jgi:hypothetical protein
MIRETFIEERLAMIYTNPFSDRFFFQSHKALIWETFVFGGVLFLLAILIFTYPALIAYFFAGIILLAGVSAFALTWRLWRYREKVSRVEQWPVDNNSEYRARVTYFRWHA